MQQLNEPDRSCEDCIQCQSPCKIVKSQIRDCPCPLYFCLGLVSGADVVAQRGEIPGQGGDVDGGHSGPGHSLSTCHHLTMTACQKIETEL